MKKCPVCHQSFTNYTHLKKTLSKPFSKRLEESISDRRGIIRCPHCDSRLKKKLNIWVIPALLPVLFSTILYCSGSNYSYLFIITLVLFIIFYGNLPFEPYD